MMSKYEKLCKSSDSVFRRITGVKHETFSKMVDILVAKYNERMKKGGRPRALSITDMLLATLEYLREYRTYLHIGNSYGISESAAYNTIRWVENTLVRHPDFSLPGRKELKKRNMAYEVILIDATETPIERPKKNKSTFIQARKKGTLLRASL
jgi:Helix-turn-helix of DDE superfamily endonuclease